jgi:hypothetical protein
MGQIPNTLSRSVERYGLGHVRPRHEEIARRLTCGQTQAEIARALGMNQGRLSIIINSPLFKLVLAKLKKERDANAVDIREDIRRLQAPAVDTIAKTMFTGQSEKLRMLAAQDLLDRGDIAKKGSSPMVGVQVNIHPVDLSEYKNDVTVEAHIEDANASECKKDGLKPSNGDGEEDLSELMDEVEKDLDFSDESKTLAQEPEEDG